MQISPGSTVNANPLYSTSGQLRGSDTPVFSGLVYSGTHTSTAGPTDVQIHQLWNRIENDINIFVDRVTLVAQLQTDVLITLGGDVQPGANSIWQNQLSGGPAGMAVIRINSGLPGSIRVVDSVRLMPDETFIYTPVYPLALPPAGILSLLWDVDGSTVTTTFTGREIGM